MVDRVYLETHHPQLVATIVAEGAAEERERLARIRSLHGPDEVKAECMADPECSVQDAALRINEAERALQEIQSEALRNRLTGQPTTPVSA